MGARTYDIERWDIHICKPQPRWQCQARPEWMQRRCTAASGHLMTKGGLTVGVCGNHRKSLEARGWKYDGPVPRPMYTSSGEPVNS